MIDRYEEEFSFFFLHFIAIVSKTGKDRLEKRHCHDCELTGKHIHLAISIRTKGRLFCDLLSLFKALVCVILLFSLIKTDRDVRSGIRTSFLLSYAHRQTSGLANVSVFKTM